MSEAICTPKLRFPEFNNNWNTTILREYVEKHKGGASLKPKDFVKKSNYEVIPKKAIQSGGVLVLDKENPTYCSEKFFNDNSRNIVDSSYLITTLRDLVPSGPSIGYIVRNHNANSLMLAQGVYGFILKDSVNIGFLIHISNRTDFRRLMQKIMVGSTQVHIRNQDFFGISLNLPSKTEQQKIASFLTSLDTKIEKLIKKQELLTEYKRGLMQKIFSQEIRFKADDGSNYPDWKEKILGEYLTHKSKKNRGVEVDLVLSVNNKKGFITQDEQFDGYQVASKDLSNYKIVKKGEYAYNPSRINVGSIARLKNYNIGIVSPMYVIFKLKKLDSVFFDNLYQTHYFKHLVKIGCSGSVRDSLNFNDMADFLVTIPSSREQTKIANFLSSIDNKIEQIVKQLDETKQFKKALLQQMFV
jgi:type I restriction enzyme, S subunit